MGRLNFKQDMLNKKMNFSFTRYITVGLFLILIFGTVCCRHGHSSQRRLDAAEQIMEDNPESAFSILKGIKPDSLEGDEEKARYALLMSMALDKNYIDTTNFNVLNPAIDYYIKKGKGTADEKLKTLYYQGNIYFNAGNFDDAMMTFIKGKDLKEITDSLTYARLLVLQGTLYIYQYKAQKCIDNNLIAAPIYKKYKKLNSEISCYTRALGVAVNMDNMVQADSLYKICNRFATQYPERADELLKSTLIYRVESKNENEIREVLSKFPGYDYPDNIKLNIVRGYLNINEPEKALDYLNSIKLPLEVKLNISYYILRSDAEEMAGDYKAALKSYQQFTDTLEAFHDNLFDHDLMFSEKKHELEIKTLMEVEKRNRFIIVSVALVILLLVAGGLLYYRYRLIRTKKELAEEERQRLQLENERQESELESLQLDKLHLEELLDEEKSIAEPLRNIIKERMDFIGEKLSKEMANRNSKDGTKKEKGKNDDREEFIESTRRTLKVVYPEFMNYIESFGLDEVEMKYVCLYSLGLRGKDIGEYVDSKRHYIITSNIRKKLGIEKMIRI